MSAVERKWTVLGYGVFLAVSVVGLTALGLRAALDVSSPTRWVAATAALAGGAAFCLLLRHFGDWLRQPVSPAAGAFAVLAALPALAADFSRPFPGLTTAATALFLAAFPAMAAGRRVRAGLLCGSAVALAPAFAWVLGWLALRREVRVALLALALASGAHALLGAVGSEPSGACGEAGVREALGRLGGIGAWLEDPLRSGLVDASLRKGVHLCLRGGSPAAFPDGHSSRTVADVVSAALGIGTAALFFALSRRRRRGQRVRPGARDASLALLVAFLLQGRAGPELCASWVAAFAPGLDGARLAGSCRRRRLGYALWFSAAALLWVALSGGKRIEPVTALAVPALAFLLAGRGFYPADPLESPRGGCG